jgi:putative glutamine amidotransferase
MTRPVIGMTIELEHDPLTHVVENELRSVMEQAGAIVITLPRSTPVADIDALLAIIDGVTLSGGADVDPSQYGEQRHDLTQPAPAAHDAFEIGIARRALQTGLPLLGICRGAQVVAVADGGGLTQDVPTLHDGAHRHTYPWRELALVPAAEHWHEVDVRPGSRVERWFGDGPRTVNTFHHQAIARTGERLVPTAWSRDGVVEAVESSATRQFAVGLQWHNEMMWRHDKRFRAPHAELVEAAAAFRAGRSRRQPHASAATTGY